MNNKVKLLCVGIGGYAEVYLSYLLAQPNPAFEIVGMVEVAPDRCKLYPRLAERGVPLYATMEAFYAHHTADLAILVTPIFLHTRQILCALAHGSHVLCEKPLSGVSTDEQQINRAAQQAGKFVMVGYQWSYSEAINRLKDDISAGVYGAPVFLKSITLWPRPVDYFTRGTGWGGKRQAPDGTVMNDSVLNNATAHYLHNMLYVTGGAPGKAAISAVSAWWTPSPEKRLCRYRHAPPGNIPVTRTPRLAQAPTNWFSRIWTEHRSPCAFWRYPPPLDGKTPRTYPHQKATLTTRQPTGCRVVFFLILMNGYTPPALYKILQSVTFF